MPASDLSRSAMQMQFGLAIAERFQRAHRFDHVVAVGPGLTVTLPHMMHALGERQPPGILDVAAVDDEAERPDLPPRWLFQLDPPHRSPDRRSVTCSRARR